MPAVNDLTKSPVSDLGAPPRSVEEQDCTLIEPLPETVVLVYMPRRHRHLFAFRHGDKTDWVACFETERAAREATGGMIAPYTINNVFPEPSEPRSFETLCFDAARSLVQSRYPDHFGLLVLRKHNAPLTHFVR